jgi:hypothetical protein
MVSLVIESAIRIDIPFLPLRSKTCQEKWFGDVPVEVLEVSEIVFSFLVTGHEHRAWWHVTKAVAAGASLASEPLKRKTEGPLAETVLAAWTARQRL